MRLITQNMLVCNVKACVATASRDGTPKNYPLKVVVAASGGLAKKPSDFNATFIKHILPKLDWKALALTAKQMGVATLPDAIPAGADKDEAFLKSVHDLILDLHVQEGTLVCPNCERVYKVNEGIPNMLLHEDEV